MRARILVGCFLAIAAALLLKPFYILPDSLWSIALATSLLAGYLLRSEVKQELPVWHKLLLIVLPLALIPLHGRPWQLPLGLLAFSGLIGLLPLKQPKSFASGLGRAAVALYIGLLLVGPASVIQAMIDCNQPVALLAEGLGRLLGMDVALVSADLVWQTAEESLHFSMAPEWTGLYLWLVIAALMLAGLLDKLFDKSIAFISALARFGSFLIASWLWFALLVLIHMHQADMHNIFEWPMQAWLQIVAALPVALLAGWLSHGEPASPAAGANKGPRQLIWSLATWLLMLASLLVQDPGVKKPGRVMIDDGHSDWEWAGEAMNTREFGTKTTYNYHGLARLLSRVYDVTVTQSGISDSLLADVDVLILKTPTRPYTEEEQQAILDWVKAGGGLYLISDHTDIFGMSSYINEFSHHFGFIYNKDTVFDLTSTRDQYWPGPDTIVHPAARHVPWYHYLTGCSIKPGPGCEVVMTGPNTGSDLLSYATSNFFDTWYPRTELRFGNLVQLVASRYGKGRVVGFSDSTTYSNFAMFLPGRLEHLISIVEWLNRRNSLLPWRLLFSLAALAFAFKAVRSGASSREQLLPALISLLIVLPLSRGFAELSYPWPENKRDLPTASLDTLYSHLTLPLKNKLEAETPRDMETFYIWQYRSERIPELVSGAPSPCSKIHFVINPRSIPDERDTKAMDQFMRDGGTLAVIGSPGNIVNGINQWLDPYGVGFVKDRRSNVEVLGGDHAVPVFAHAVQGVKGGDTIYQLADSLAVATETQVDAGRLIVSGLAECFETRRLGRYDSIPSGLAYEYLQMYYRHSGMDTGQPIEASSGRSAR